MNRSAGRPTAAAAFLSTVWISSRVSCRPFSHLAKGRRASAPTPKRWGILTATCHTAVTTHMAWSDLKCDLDHPNDSWSALCDLSVAPSSSGSPVVGTPSFLKAKSHPLMTLPSPYGVFRYSDALYINDHATRSVAHKM